ncbi:MAG TPA: FecR domain-containing protein [Vicinamibacterales bacterium]|jgi:hypothetical protein
MNGLVRSLAALAIVAAVTSPAAAQAPAPAGHIKTVSGTALIVREHGTTTAKPGDPIYATDTLRTAPDSTVGVTLQDDTRVSLGPNSEMKVDRYVYSPGEGGFGMVLQFVRGVAVYISGRMAKLAPDSVRLETPSAIVGVRGTTVAIRVGV